ncbi:MAG: glycosyltransferase family 2 protein [Spirulinaceae cyanobacterium]
MINYRVAAYITAYKDEQAVKKCLQGIKQQSHPVEKVFILDNSPAPIVSPQNNYLLIKHCPNNLGIGAGLSMALAWAIEAEYDFLWSFDQDSYPTQNCLEILLISYQELVLANYSIGIIAATPIDTRSKQTIGGAMYNGETFIENKPNGKIEPYQCDAPITSGSLVSLSAAQTIAPPKAELFIDGIDFDYGMRLKQKEFDNFIVPKAIMHHNFGNPVQVIFLGKKKTIHQYSALRRYYICRNHTYLETRYAQGWHRIISTLERLKFMLKQIIAILIYDPEQTLTKVWACLIGTYDGLIGKLGKTWH